MLILKREADCVKLKKEKKQNNEKSRASLDMIFEIMTKLHVS